MCAKKDSSTQTPPHSEFLWSGDRMCTKMECPHGVPYIVTAEDKNGACSKCEPELFPENSDFADLPDAGFDDAGWLSFAPSSAGHTPRWNTSPSPPMWGKKDAEVEMEEEDEEWEEFLLSQKDSKDTTDAEATTGAPLPKAKKSSSKFDAPKASQGQAARSSTTRSTKLLKAPRKTKGSVGK